MSFQLNLNNLFTFLEKNQLNPIHQKESDQIYILFKHQNHDIHLFFVVAAQNQLLKLIAYFPFHLLTKSVPDVARVLHFLNKEIDMPGFGMDEKENLIFFRASILAVDSQIDEKSLIAHIGCTHIACDSFMHAIGMIAAGKVSADEFIKKKQA